MKYLEGFLTTHRLMQLCKLMVKSSGTDLTLNEVIILATIGRDKKEIREIHKATMIDKATIVRTLTILKDKKMVSKISINSNIYYMMTVSAINLFDKIQQDNNDALSSLNSNEIKKITSCTLSMKEVADIITKFLAEE